MSNIGSYTNRSFSETQKFLVLDPATGTTSLVLGSDLVSYITPRINSVIAETTRAAAENTDYAVGEIIQTSGGAAPGDGLSDLYLVVAAGEGDFPMINGNELLILPDDGELRADLASDAAGEGAALVSMEGGPTVETAVNNRVIRVSSRTEMKAYDVPAGYQFSFDGYNWVVSAGTPPSDPDEGIYVVLSNGNYAERIFDGGVQVGWFNILGDGSDEQDKLQRAVDLTPIGKECILPVSESGILTITVDIPSGQTGISSKAIEINKAVTLVGNPSCKIKLKDFCSAYMVDGGTLDVITLSASGAKALNVEVDANADNHYVIDGSGFKWWEVNTGGKSPAYGIVIRNADLAPNIVGAKIKDCVIERPLGGACIFGALNNTRPFNDPALVDGTIDDSVCVDCEVAGNRIVRARGNDTLVFGGGLRCRIYNNTSINSMYHNVRFYTAAVDCVAYDNRAYVDYGYISTLYNATDNGYWRTDNAGDSEYKIRRSGFMAGGAFSPGESVVNCEIYENKLKYESNTHVSIIDETSNLAYAFRFSGITTGCIMRDNEVVNSPFGECSWFIDSASASPENISALMSNNRGYNSNGRAGNVVGKKIRTLGNKSFDNKYAGGPPWVMAASASWQIHEFNEVYNLVGTANEYAEYLNGSGSAYFVDGWRTFGYVRTLLNSSGGSDAFAIGSMTSGIPLTLINGWTSVDLGLSSGQDPCMNLSGNIVTVVAYLNGTSSTSDQFYLTPFGYTPSELSGNSYDTCVKTDTGASFPVRVTAGGGGLLLRNGATPTNVAVRIARSIVNSPQEILNSLV